MANITPSLRSELMARIGSLGGASGAGAKKKRSKAHYQRLAKLSKERAKARKEARAK